MKVLKNQSGMVLALTLFLIVLFSIVGIAIFNFTVTNAKQTANIEEDMVAVDVAEMGMKRYRAELIQKVNEELTNGITTAIQSIELENGRIAEANKKLSADKQSPYIQINKETIIQYMKNARFFDNANRFNIGYTPTTKYYAFQGSTDYYYIEESGMNKSHAQFPNKLQVNVKSTGITMDKTKEIDATIEFDLGHIVSSYIEVGKIITETKSTNNTPHLMNNDAVNQSVGKKQCGYTKILEHECIYPNRLLNGYYIESHIENIDSYVKENLIVQKGDVNITNSNLYVDGNILTSTIKQISNTKLQAKGNITFGNMNGNATIDNVQLKATDKINFGTIGGAGIVNSKIHGGEQLNFDNINNGGISATELSSNKEINFKNLNKGITNSLIYAKDNINFNDSMNDGGIINSTIITLDILNLPIMNKGIVDSYIYAKNNLNFDMFNGSANISNSIIYNDDIMYFKKGFDGKIQNGSVIYSSDKITNITGFNGSIDASSFVCAKGSISINIKNKATNNNVVENVSSLEACLTLAGKTLNKNEVTIEKSTLLDFYTELEKATENASYIYK